ncbi:MAG: polysaccharide biosynthesis/export family protein [Candidatus Eremiobacteraeota bacterium]|nr:polysaccharide biosynthesis/export family protein [Candidatus Eremiobacteraeota bacterium]
MHRYAVPLAILMLLLPGVCLPAWAGGQMPLTANTFIHPGDQLAVQVFGDQTLTQNVTVLADGTIDYPLVGRVPVAGKTPSQAAALLALRLHDYVRHPVVTIAIAQLAQPNVLVLGAVKNPGKYQLPADGKVSDAIAAAGGIAESNGDYPDARVMDANGSSSNVSLQKLLRKGDTTVDRTLGEGSVVYVPGPVQFTVDVAGAVDHPGDVQVSEGDRLSVAIAKAGNSVSAESDLNHIRLIRTGADGKQETTEINLYDALKAGNQSVDVALQKGDVIYVPQARKGSFANGLLYLLTKFIP